jgi:acyl carrier protein
MDTPCAWVGPTAAADAPSSAEGGKEWRPARSGRGVIGSCSYVPRAMPPGWGRHRRRTASFLGDAPLLAEDLSPVATLRSSIATQRGRAKSRPPVRVMRARSPSHADVHAAPVLPRGQRGDMWSRPQTAPLAGLRRRASLLGVKDARTAAAPEPRGGQAVASTVERFIRDELTAGRGAGPIGADEDLIVGGVIDSLGIQELIAFLEDRFGITVLDEDLLPQNFQSLRNIEAFIASRSGEPSRPRRRRLGGRWS